MAKLAWYLELEYLFVARRVVRLGQDVAIKLHHAEDMVLRILPRLVFGFRNIDKSQLRYRIVSRLAPRFRQFVEIPWHRIRTDRRQQVTSMTGNAPRRLLGSRPKPQRYVRHLYRPRGKRQFLDFREFTIEGHTL